MRRGHSDLKAASLRSSASVEDSAAHSFAGMFASVMPVPASGLCEAVQAVRASTGSSRLLAYCQRLGIAVDEVTVAVVLQPYIPATHSGVWIGTGPDSGLLEWVTGAGEALVAGRVDPRAEDWKAGTSDVASPLTSSSGPVGAAALAVQRSFGTALDLELALDGERLVWLQARPVTTPPAEGCSATAASAGQVAGEGLYRAGPDDERWIAGSILLADNTDPDWVPLKVEAAGLVTSHGGRLSHAAIVARELGIPCVTGVPNTSLRSYHEQLLSVDGTKGTVRVLAESGRAA